MNCSLIEHKWITCGIMQLYSYKLVLVLNTLWDRDTDNVIFHENNTECKLLPAIESSSYRQYKWQMAVDIPPTFPNKTANLHGCFNLVFRIYHSFTIYI